MRILVIGDTGMLGKRVASEVLRRDCELERLNTRYVPPNLGTTIYDAIINCAGVIPERMEDYTGMVKANAFLPWYWAATLRTNHFVHVSTDCVYNEASIEVHQPSEVPGPWSAYGKAKLAGEPIDPQQPNPAVTVVRTSFVGPDHGLQKKFLDHQDGDMVIGWEYAYWSGSTVWEVARALVDIAIQQEAGMGIINLATLVPITKYRLLGILNRAHYRHIVINPEPNPYVNRAMLPTWLLDPFQDALLREVGTAWAY